MKSRKSWKRSGSSKAYSSWRITANTQTFLQQQQQRLDRLSLPHKLFPKVHILPLHQGPQGAPKDPLPASSGVTVRVEKSHSRAAILSPAGLSAALQPHAEPQQQQQEGEGQDQAQVEAWHQQRPQQPAEGTATKRVACATLKTSGNCRQDDH